MNTLKKNKDSFYRVDHQLFFVYLVTSAIVIGVSFFHFYPGAMSYDSFAILDQARSGLLSDAHPPFLALTWRVFDSLVPGPVGILILHFTLYYGGLFFIFYSTFALDPK